MTGTKSYLCMTFSDGRDKWVDAIDSAVREAGADRDVISVTTTPIAAPGGATDFVVVTVVWRN